MAGLGVTDSGDPPSATVPTPLIATRAAGPISSTLGPPQLNFAPSNAAAAGMTVKLPFSTAEPAVEPSDRRPDVDAPGRPSCKTCAGYKQLLVRVGIEIQAYQSLFHGLATWLDGEMHAGVRRLQAWEYLRREAIRLGRAPIEGEVIDLATSLRDEMTLGHMEFEGDRIGAAEAMFGEGGQMWSEGSGEGNNEMLDAALAVMVTAAAGHSRSHSPLFRLPCAVNSPTSSPVSSGGFSNLSQDDPDAMDLDSSSADDNTEEE